MKKLILSLIILLLAGCNKGDGEVINKFEKSDEFVKALEEVSKRKIYFGHQSVGYNIMDGILDIHEGKLSIVDLEKDKYEENESAAFVHGKIGENFYPLTKIESFEKELKENFKISPNIAVMKFCFVDIDRTSDVKKLTVAYDEMVKRFKEENSTISLVHTTVPLTPVGGLKGQVKALIKAILQKEDSNIKRMEYNQHIRNNYGNDNLFDIAKLESTYSGGKGNTKNKKGFTYEIMLDEYNLDCGHFNIPGRQFMAGEFIKFLAGVKLAEKANVDELKEEGVN